MDFSSYTIFAVASGTTPSTVSGATIFEDRGAGSLIGPMIGLETGSGHPGQNTGWWATARDANGVSLVPTVGDNNDVPLAIITSWLDAPSKRLYLRVKVADGNVYDSNLYDPNYDSSSTFEGAPTPVISGLACCGNVAGIIGNIGEILIYNSALSTTDRQTVEDYLNSKYNTTGGPAGPAHSQVRGFRTLDDLYGSDNIVNFLDYAVMAEDYGKDPLLWP